MYTFCIAYIDNFLNNFSQSWSFAFLKFLYVLYYGKERVHHSIWVYAALTALEKVSQFGLSLPWRYLVFETKVKHGWRRLPGVVPASHPLGSHHLAEETPRFFLGRDTEVMRSCKVLVSDREEIADHLSPWPIWLKSRFWSEWCIQHSV
jgi:hypothetical protein